MRFLFSLLLIVFIFFETTAQNSYLLLSNLRKSGKVYYEKGEVLRFKIQNDTIFLALEITEFDETVIIFDDISVNLDTIQIVDIRNKNGFGTGLSRAGGQVMFVGVGYLVIDWFNRRVVSKGKGGLDKKVTKTSAGIFTGGLLMSLIKPKYFKIGNGNKISIIENSIIVE
jgi:hypothetical protein